MIGRILGGRYLIKDKIGTGGMAIVYSALDQRLNRMVAVKLLQTEEHNEETMKRLNTEALAVATLNHPNVVSVYDMSTDENDGCYIVMELVNGITLKEYIEQHAPLPWDEVIRFAIQICDALTHAHEHKIIHRDVKPQNMIVTHDGNIKVTDFGIALAQSGTKTKTNNSMGTVHYLSPEQARGGFCNETSDIYSLGVTLYEMATGKVPFDGEMPVSIAMKHLDENPTPPSELNPHIPPALESLILKAMQKEQSSRYASAADMRQDLTGIIDNPVMKIEIPMSNPKDNKDVDKKAGSDQEQQKEKLGVIIGVVVSVVLVVTMLAILIATMFGGGEHASKFSMPQLVGMTVEEANLAYSDSGITIVVGRNMASDTFAEGKICEQDVDYGSKISVPKTVYVVVSTGKEKISLSDYTTMDYRDVILDLQKKKIYYTLKFEANDEFPENTVFDQEPKPKSDITEEDTIILYVSNGTENSTVPSVLGFMEESATQMLTESDLIPKTVYEFDDNVMEGKVISQNIQSGTSVPKRTTIEIVISKGKDLSKIESDEPINEETSVKENDNETETNDLSGVVSNDGL